MDRSGWRVFLNRGDTFPARLIALVWLVPPQLVIPCQRTQVSRAKPRLPGV